VRIATLKTVLSDSFLIQICNYHSQDAIRFLLERSSLGPDVLNKIIKNLIRRVEITHFDLVIKIAQHPDLDRDSLLNIWHGLKLQRTAVFFAAEIPSALQEEIAINGTPNERHNLLIHCSVREIFKPILAESLLGLKQAEFTSTAINRGNLSKSRLAELILSHDFVVASAACDRISEVASKVRLKEFSRHHFGSSNSMLNAFLADCIRRGLPLGWFVVACKLLRKSFGDKPIEFVKVIRWIASQNRSAGIRQLAWCERLEFVQFQCFIESIPRLAAMKILLGSLKAGEFNFDLIRELADPSLPFALEGAMGQLKWRNIRTLRELVAEIRWRTLLEKEKDILLRPQRHQFWPWLRHLDDLVLENGLKIVVPKTAHRIRQWGLALRNCLTDAFYAKSSASGKTVIFAVVSKRRVVYAVQLNPETGNIIQGKGVGNMDIPDDFKLVLIRAITTSRSIAQAELDQIHLAAGEPPAPS
jgi:hypothetical protein